MEFRRLSPVFYEAHKNKPEMLLKPERPYYVLLIEKDALTFGIPLRSHITHHYGFFAFEQKGLDFTKAVVIGDLSYIQPDPATICQNEYKIYKTHFQEISLQFASYIQSYKKYIQQRRLKPQLPVVKAYAYSALQYFHKELGLM